jgi:hypothetical protein
VLGRTLQHGSIEAGKINKQEACSNGGYSVASIPTHSPSFIVSDRTAAIEEKSTNNSEVGSEQMNGHTTTDIDCLEDAFANDDVQAVKDHFQGCQYKNLRERTLPHNSSEGDQASSGTVISLNKCV